MRRVDCSNHCWPVLKYGMTVVLLSTLPGRGKKAFVVCLVVRAWNVCQTDELRETQDRACSASTYN